MARCDSFAIAMPEVARQRAGLLVASIGAVSLVGLGRYTDLRRVYVTWQRT